MVFLDEEGYDFVMWFKPRDNWSNWLIDLNAISNIQSTYLLYKCPNSEQVFLWTRDNTVKHCEKHRSFLRNKIPFSINVNHHIGSWKYSSGSWFRLDLVWNLHMFKQLITLTWLIFLRSKDAVGYYFAGHITN